MNNILVFDLEVVPYDFDTTYDEETKKYLLKSAKGDAAKEEEIKMNLVFSPFTSKLVAIGMLDVEKYFDHTKYDTVCSVLVNDENKEEPLPEGTDEIEDDQKLEKVQYIFGDEKEILNKFWALLKERNYRHFVTFNGREFDCPYIMLRSFIQNVKPSRNLMDKSDFNFKEYHTDLMKEFSYYKNVQHGAAKKYNLDFYCKMLGVKSPKGEGVSGEMVSELYSKKQYYKLANYCLGDVVAEAKLFRKWKEFLSNT